MSHAKAQSHPLRVCAAAPLHCTQLLIPIAACARPVPCLAQSDIEDFRVRLECLVVEAEEDGRRGEETGALRLALALADHGRDRWKTVPVDTRTQ